MRCKLLRNFALSAPFGILASDRIERRRQGRHAGARAGDPGLHGQLLKGGLISAKLQLPPKQQEVAALGLIDLADASYEDAMMLYWLHGVLWKIAKRYRA